MNYKISLKKKKRDLMKTSLLVSSSEVVYFLFLVISHMNSKRRVRVGREEESSTSKRDSERHAERIPRSSLEQIDHTSNS